MFSGRFPPCKMRPPSLIAKDTSFSIFSNCPSVHKGPICVSSNNGSPILICFAIFIIRSKNSSAISSCKYNREPATQLCPAAPKIPATDPLTALSILASSNTINGDLPPNSKLTSAKFSAELYKTWRAAFGPPVKEIRATKG